MLLRTDQETSVAFRSAKAAYFRGAKGDNLLRYLAVCGLLLVVPRFVAAADPSAADSSNAASPKGIADIRAWKTLSGRRSRRLRPASFRWPGRAAWSSTAKDTCSPSHTWGSVRAATLESSFLTGGECGPSLWETIRVWMPGWSRLHKGPWPSVAGMGRSADLKPGQWCLTLGYPMTFEAGKPPLVRIGRAAAPSEDRNHRRLHDHGWRLRLVPCSTWMGRSLESARSATTPWPGTSMCRSTVFAMNGTSWQRARI